MSSKPTPSPATRAFVLQELNAGRSLRMIAREIGWPGNRAYTDFRQEYLSSRSAVGRKAGRGGAIILSPLEVRIIKRLRAFGVNVKDIGSIVGHSATSLYLHASDVLSAADAEKRNAIRTAKAELRAERARAAAAAEAKRIALPVAATEKPAAEIIAISVPDEIEGSEAMLLITEWREAGLADYQIEHRLAAWADALVPHVTKPKA